MLMLKSKELREKRAKLVADSRALLDKPELTAEIRTQVEQLDKDIEQANKDIELYEKQEQRERELATKGKAIIEGEGSEDKAEARKKEIEKEVREYTEAFRAYMVGGLENCSPEQRSALKKGYRDEKRGEQRAQTITTTGGGYLIPQGFQAELEKTLLQFGGVRQASRILVTGSGNPLPWPTVDDTGNTGEDSAINTNASEEDVVFGQKTLNAYKMDSGLVLVPTELFEDSAINIDETLGELLGERLGRRQNSKYTTGSGAGDFQGCVTASTLGITSAVSATMSADDLIDLQHKVDPAYRVSPKCRFMMNDDTQRQIRHFKDSNGRYLLDYSTLPGEFSKLLGYDVITNQQMAVVAASAIVALFGDFSKFVIRDVRGIVVRRLNELYAQADQIGFIAWYRGDSRFVCTSTKALVNYTLHA